MTKAGFVNGSCKAAVASGDVWFELDYSTSRSFAWGYDESAGLLKLNTTNSITINPSTGTNVMSMTTAGAFNYPLQPCFSAFLAVTDSDVTGDGTVYTIGSGNVFTILKNQSTSFVNTGTYTAPVSGNHLFNVNTQLHDLTVAITQITARVATTGGTFEEDWNFSNAGVSYNNVGCSAIAVMAALDTATFLTSAAGSTKTVDVFAGFGTTYFQGTLLN